MWGWKKDNLIMVVILSIAFLLRLYQLGQDSFWFDEAGVVVAASAETLSETLQIAQSHVSAMPLNYLITRFILKFGNDEGLLRLPSAVWGSMTVWAFFKLVTFLVNKKTAFCAALLLAIHPFHIQYSQELRFYASGSFFYLIGTYLLLNAMERNKFNNWLLAVVVILIGVYDFPYTIFSLMNVVLISSVIRKYYTKDRWLHLILAGFIILIGFLPGYFIFGIENKMNYDISGNQILQNLFQGMGWLPYIVSNNFASYWMGLLLFLFFVIGLIIVFRKRVFNIFMLLLSICIQMSLIIGSLLNLNYFVSARQFLVFLPIGLLFSAYFLVHLLTYPKPILPFKTYFSEQNSINFKNINFVFGISLSIFTIVLSIPALQNYYQSSKSYAGEVVEVLSQQLQPKDLIICVPNYESLLFEYYFQKNHISLKENQLTGLNTNDLRDALWDKETVYLITRSDLTKEQTDLIFSKGFILTWANDGTNPDAHRLYTHSKELVVIP